MTVADQSLRFLKGVGPRLEELLQRMGIHTLADLVYHYPREYEDRRRVWRLADLELAPPRVLVRVRIALVQSRPGRAGRRTVTARVADDSGQAQAVWFNRREQGLPFAPDEEVLLWGEVRREGALWQLLQPEVVRADGQDLVAVYPATAGIAQQALRRWVSSALERLRPTLADPLPADLRLRRGLLDRPLALERIHHPGHDQALAEARRRLKYDELFALQLGLALRRAQCQSPGAGAGVVPIIIDDAVDRRLRERLGVRPTPGQSGALDDIRRDLAGPGAMGRLLQGDVGSGKTAVALYAILAALESGHQAALMAPTEILARQHRRRLEPVLRDAGYAVVLLAGQSGARARRQVLEELESGAARLAIGTHALAVEDVRFQDLALAVVDEQHKFGVLQRQALIRKGRRPHTLVMTATPIPRTLAMSVYGDLDLSVIPDLPPGRRPVHTEVFPPGQRHAAFQRLRAELDLGFRAFFIFPVIEPSEVLPVTSAQEGFEVLRGGPLRGYRLALLHGQMADAEQESALEDFRAGRVQVLVATSMVEVGLDVPEATMVLVAHPERFGLAQLHQMRGRVGRGQRPGCCFLLDPGLSAAARERLDLLARTASGFDLAEADLKLRGPGEVLGTRQHGLPAFALADLATDSQLLAQAQADARALLASDPALERPEHAALAAELGARYREAWKLAEVG